MMFLQFAAWGGFWMNLGMYMGTDRVDMASLVWLAFLTGPIGAIISPFFLGLVADRFFASERVLAVMHLIAGMMLFLAPTFAAGPWQSPTIFIALLMIYMLCYMPTIGLTNTLSFHNIPKQEQFSYVRVFGTLGWIVSSGLVVGLWLQAEEQALSLYIAGGTSLGLALYSLTLPHTPPPAAGKEVRLQEIIGIDAVRRLSSRPFWVFIAASILICIPLAVYFPYMGPFLNATTLENENFRMAFGQMSELLLMVAMPLGFAYLGTKWVLVVGMGAWALRYALFALGAPDSVAWMIMLGIILHGVCFDFFFVAGQIYVDKKAPSDIRGQAQGFIVWVTYGIGMFIGTAFGGWVVFNNTVTASEPQEQLPQYQTFWWIWAALALVVMIGFAILFNDREVDAKTESSTAEAPAEEPVLTSE
jgi:nucleoside transporter